MRVVNGKEKSFCVWARGGGFRGNERERGCLKESVCILPGHGVPSWGCWGCVGGAVRGGTAESQVVPLRKKSDIREGRGQRVGWGGGVKTWRSCPIKIIRKGKREGWGSAGSL